METKNTLNLLVGHVAKALNQEAIDADVAIGELGFDSMRVVELILICDELYETSIDPESINLDQFTTLRGLDEQFQAMAAKARAQTEVATAK
ncbi:acyl carrier protein [Ideonella sp.]|uniref:acyl carrier protein n=1 Tax=Ideonella sp. TaxID=1929293 RepID=UPI0035B31A50